MGLISAMDTFCATFSTSNGSHSRPVSPAVSLHVSNPSKFSTPVCVFCATARSAVKFVSRSSGGSNLIDTTAATVGNSRAVIWE